jgi:hypothetical protein
MSGKNGQIIFAIEEAAEGGYVARALGNAIVTEAEDLHALREAIDDAVRCHFDEAHRPKIILLHFVGQEDPFTSFEEWTSETDTKGYAAL